MFATSRTEGSLLTTMKAKKTSQATPIAFWNEKKDKKKVFAYKIFFILTWIFDTISINIFILSTMFYKAWSKCNAPQW